VTYSLDLVHRDAVTKSLICPHCQLPNLFYAPSIVYGSKHNITLDVDLDLACILEDELGHRSTPFLSVEGRCLCLSRVNPNLCRYVLTVPSVVNVTVLVLLPIVSAILFEYGHKY